MATPSTGTLGVTGNPLIDGLLQGSSWNLASSNNVMTYSLHNIADGSIWISAEINAVDSGFAAWEAVANIDFQRLGSPNTYLFGTTPADIAVGFTGLELQSLIEPGVLGIAVFPNVAAGNGFLNILSDYAGVSITRADYPSPEGDIFIDDFSSSWYPYVFPGDYGFFAILHEIGHALGLKHPHDSSGQFQTFAELEITEFDTNLLTVMSYNQIPDSTADYFNPATPMFLDILAIQKIYGANTSYRTGNDTYVLAEDYVLRTIWDAGGKDTFDASNMVDPVEIDLLQNVSTYDFAYATGTGMFMGIAFGVTIENALGGAGHDLIIGNSAANTLRGNGGNDDVSGLDGNDLLVGGGGNDILRGSNGNDVLQGSAGNDSLDGGAGNDRIQGGPGNDSYVVDQVEELDKALEDGGIDIVKSRVNYTLGPQQENLTLLGAAHLNGTANSGSNVLTGNTGNNTLWGGAGNDTIKGGAGNDTLIGGSGADSLAGGAGKDIFLFGSPLNAVDAITDFSHIDDTFQLDDDVFLALATGANHTLAPSQFAKNTSGNAGDSGDRIIYNKNSGEVYYDSDGSGPALSVLVAVVSGHPDDVGYTDFMIVT